MKQPKILFLVIIALLPLTLVSCAPWGTQSAGGWAGTAFHDGIVYAATRDGRVVAINSLTENLEWSYSPTPTNTPSGGLSCGQTSITSAIYVTPVTDRDIVYISTYSGQVLALNMSARRQNLTFPQQRYGEWEWNCPIDNAKSNSIVANLEISEDALYVASSNGRVYSLDKASGDENWNREDIPVLAEKLWTSPVIQDNTLYVSIYDGHIYALSVETGELLDWSFELDSGFASSPVIYEDTIFLGSFDRHLYAIKIGSDVLEWRFPEKPAGNWFWASPVVDDGIVYAGCLDGKLYAIEADTGRERWSYLTEDQNGKPSPIVSSPVLMDNLLIVVNESGMVYVFDLSAKFGDEAEPLNPISIGTAVKSSFCVQEGLVYIRGEDNWVYAVDINEGQISWKLDLTKKEE